MTMDTEIAVIGAGPYGLSIAAHLRGRNIDHIIAGHPMDSWRNHMPKGMELKSEGFASTLYEPAAETTLARYCADRDVPYADIGIPVKVEHFCGHGMTFQERHAPDLLPKMLTALDRVPNGFALTFDDGDRRTARKVVLAVGITNFKNIPTSLSDRSERISHSFEHHDLEPFRGKDVMVLGGGSSAIDMSGLLHEAGARVRMVARRQSVEIHEKMKLPRPLIDRLRAPMSGLGPDWRSFLYCNLPLVFHLLPEKRRLSIVRRHLGPAAGWFMQGRVLGRVATYFGYDLAGLQERPDALQARLRGPDGSERWFETEHLIAATGYRVDMDRLPFLSSEIRRDLRVVQATPILSRHFESSVPGLYFTGVSAANSFGPLMRFAFGAGFAAPWVTRHLAATLPRRSRADVPMGLVAQTET